MKGITMIERIPLPFEILKSSYISKLSGKVLETSQNIAFYHLVDYSELEKNLTDRKHTSISPLELKLQRFWHSDCVNYVPLILLFCCYFPFFTSLVFVIEEMKCIERPRFWTKREGQVCVLLNTPNSSFVLRTNN